MRRQGRRKGEDEEKEIKMEDEERRDATYQIIKGRRRMRKRKTKGQKHSISNKKESRRLRSKRREQQQAYQEQNERVRVTGCEEDECVP